MMRWLEIGGERASSPVPCGVFHSGESEYGLVSRAMRTLRIQLQLLRPVTGRDLRAHARSGAITWRNASVQQREEWGPEGNAKEYWRGSRLNGAIE